MKRFIIPFIITLFLNCIWTYAQKPIVLKNQRELFVDRYLIDEVHKVDQRMISPTPTGKGMQFEKPWDGVAPAYVSIIDNGRFFQMYYRGKGQVGNRGIEVTCYAESQDGIHWAKPNIGLFEVNGTTKNNVVMVNNKQEVSHNFTVFYDTRTDISEEERYKAIGGANHNNDTRIGLTRYVSSDGIHWTPYSDTTDLFDDYALDSQNTLVWDNEEQCYVIYLRTWTGHSPGVPYPSGGIRTIAKSTSKDFKTWTKPREVTFGGTKVEHLYTNATHSYFRAPQIFVAMPFRFSPTVKVLSDYELTLNGVIPSQWKGIADAVLMTSRGDYDYDRTFMQSFIRPGPDTKNWSARCNIPAMGVIPTGPGEMSVYVTRAYGSKNTWLERLTLRTDGFASMHADYEEGYFITKPIRLEGEDLYLNFSTSTKGYIKIIVLDESGEEMEGFEEEKAPRLIGDFIDYRVTWPDNKGVSDLKNKTIRLKFVIRDADLYSLNVSDNYVKSEASNALRGGIPMQSQ